MHENTIKRASIKYKALSFLAHCNAWLTRRLDALQPLAALLARGYVAEVFLRSGLTKLRDWDTTVALFADEYHVPLLSPELAALLGTAGETLLPPLLLLGLGARVPALGLFVVNAVAAQALPDMPAAAFHLHLLWGALLAALALWGPGAWSIDAWWRARHNRCASTDHPEHP